MAKVDAELNFEDMWTVGFSAEHKTSEVKDAKVGLTELAAHAVFKQEGARYWLAYAQHLDVASVGCYQKYTGDKDFAHAYEVLYSTKEGDTSGVFNSPARVSAGGRYALSSRSSLGYGITFGSSFVATTRFAHAIDKNWRVRFSQQFDNNRPATGKRAQYDLGFDITYTL